MPQTPASQRHLRSDGLSEVESDGIKQSNLGYSGSLFYGDYMTRTLGDTFRAETA